MSQSFVNPRVLKINVGFLLAQGPGYQRTVELEIPRIHIADLELEYLRGDVRLSRNSRGVLVQGELETSVVAECSRCLAATTYPVTVTLEELFAFPEPLDTVYAVDETGILDLAPLLREEVIVSTPMVVLCHPDCAGLCPQCGQNLNKGTCDCEQDDIDPRLAILRDRLEELEGK